MLGEIYRWISRAGLLCLAVGGFVPLAAPPKNRPNRSKGGVSSPFMFILSQFAVVQRSTGYGSSAYEREAHDERK
jgi:hypothetical protein